MRTSAQTEPNHGDTARPVPRAGIIAQIQGAYYLASGAWPIISPSIFQRVTGPKLEYWLVETVGLLLVVSGAALLLAGRANRVTREIALLGAGTALVLGVVDIYCVSEPRTTRAYWLDAILEVSLVTTWCTLGARSILGVRYPTVQNRDRPFGEGVVQKDRAIRLGGDPPAGRDV